jgi:hypothetical protein
MLFNNPIKINLYYIYQCVLVLCFLAIFSGSGTCGIALYCYINPHNKPLTAYLILNGFVKDAEMHGGSTVVRLGMHILFIILAHFPLSHARIYYNTVNRLMMSVSFWSSNLIRKLYPLRYCLFLFTEGGISHGRF